MNLDEKTQELKLMIINNRVRRLNKGEYNGQQTENLIWDLLELTIKEVNELTELTEEQKYNLTQKKLQQYNGNSN